MLQLLREHTLEPELIVIDGPVHLDAAEKPGWGRQLFDALGDVDCDYVVLDLGAGIEPELLDAYAAGKLGAGSDIAAACVYLASDESAFTTGTAQVIDGGWSN